MLAHYLPQCYLNAFTADRRLYVFDRETGKLRHDSPRNVAAITDYYILTTPNGERDERVEHGLLASIEAAASPVLSRLANCEPISDDDHDIFATFLAFLCTRIPAFEETYAELNNQLGQEMFRRAAGTPELAARFLAEHVKNFSYSPEAFCDFVNSDVLTFPPEKHERIRLMIELAEPLMGGFKEMDWWLLRAGGDRRFITSDAPFGFLPLPGALPTYGELSPKVLKFFAISPAVCLMLTDRQQEAPVLATKELDDETVREVNGAIAVAAVRLIISQESGDIETVLNDTNLRTSSFKPRTQTVKWEDSGDERSFGLDVRIHFNTTFPLELPLGWLCRSCGVQHTEVFAITEELTAARPHAYAAWLDRPCTNCGRSPRLTRSTLGGEDLVYLSFSPGNPSPPNSR